LLTRLINLAEKKLHVDALVSLHAPNDDIRRRTMPVARRWPMEELMRACRDYI
jgi:23S rRNA (adenine2503-C2)-methyltransferase